MSKNFIKLKYLFSIRNVVLLLLVCCHSVCVSQLYYKGKNLSTDDGLSDNRVTCFLKDKTGYIWIGTKNGLNRYDGHSFKVFRPGNGNSISNETINDIACDSSGNIWVATMAGLNCYNPSTGYWNVILPGAVKGKNDIPNIIIWDLWFDDAGLLWIAPDVFEFCSFDIKKKKFTYYNWPGFARKNLNSTSKGTYNSIQRFTKKSNHEFWLGTMFQPGKYFFLHRVGMFLDMVKIIKSMLKCRRWQKRIHQ